MGAELRTWSGSHARAARIAPPRPSQGIEVSRRAMLAILAGASTVRVLPGNVDARAAKATTANDAGLIALGARTEILAAAFRAAVRSLVATDDRLDELERTRLEALPQCHTQDGTDLVAAGKSSVPVQMVDGAPHHMDPGSKADAIELEEDPAALTATRLAAAARSRRRAALRRYDRTNRRVVEAAAALARLEAVSDHGASAKARACAAALDAHGNREPPDWLSDLIQTTMRDVVATCGAM